MLLQGGAATRTLVSEQPPGEKGKSSMKFLKCCPCLVLLAVAAPLAAQTKSPAPPPADEQARAALARLIHKAIVAKLPAVYEDASGWGHTVPLPERLRAPRLKRKVVQVGDHQEVPDGAWHKVRLWMDRPDRDLQVRVRSFKCVGANTYRLVAEVDATGHAEADLQRWRNGLDLLDVTAKADVAMNVQVECDVASRLDLGRVPPLILEPEIKDLKLNLKQFTPKRVTFRRSGVAIGGPGVEAVGDELKGKLQDLLRSKEPDLKKRAGEALARSLKEGKELPAAELLKAVGALLGAEK
jgi:hypothetical protein